MSKRKKRIGPSWEQIKADAIARGGVLCTLRIEYRRTARTPVEKALSDQLRMDDAWKKKWKATEEEAKTTGSFRYPW